MQAAGCLRSHAFSPEREAKLREREARRRRTRRSASMQRVTNNSDKQGEGGEAETSCAGLHARPKDWAFQNQCAHLDSMLFTARGISAHFAYTSIGSRIYRQCIGIPANLFLFLLRV